MAIIKINNYLIICIYKYIQIILPHLKTKNK
jgi:hypothetical protein